MLTFCILAILWICEGFKVNLGLSKPSNALPRVTQVNKNLQLPVWPVVPGFVSLFIEKFLKLPALAKPIYNFFGGRVTPMSPDELSPFLLLVHHKHSFSPFDPFRIITRFFLPEGFPAHPHSGFDTVTYCLEGGLKHRDSEGLAMVYGNGDVQWMRAGRGTIHEEMWDVEKKAKHQKFELYQIWVDLPESMKYLKPQVNLLKADKIPLHVCSETGTQTKVICGNVAGTRGPGSEDGISQSPLAILHSMVPKGQKVKFTIDVDDDNDNDYNSVDGKDNVSLGPLVALCYVREGGLYVNTDTNENLLLMSGDTLHTIWPTYSNNDKKDLNKKKANLEIQATSTEPLDILVLIGRSVATLSGAKSGPFVCSDEVSLRKVTRAFNRINARGGFWDHKSNNEDWLKIVEEIDLQGVLKEELELDLDT